jgi:hypothetical protein
MLRLSPDERQVDVTWVLVWATVGVGTVEE